MTNDDHDRPRADDDTSPDSLNIVGAYVTGGIGGIHVGGDLDVTSTVTNETRTVTTEQRQRIQDVVDAAVAADLWEDPQVRQMLQDVADAMHSGQVQPSAVRRLLRRIEARAGSAAAVIAAAQLAQTAFAG